jgi:cysteinyl-tRNA synthetase
MAEELLGVGFAIHGGGSDLVFPHHENEAAQTRAGRGAELAQIWMHNGMLLSGAEKMAKSVGNIAALADVVSRWGRDAVILAFAAAHYRQPMRFDESVMEQATRSVARIRETGRRLHPGPSDPDLGPHRDRFFDALADDFKTAAALAALWEWIREANRRGDAGDADLREMLGVLALENLLEAEAGAPPEVVELARRRQEARAAKDFASADRLRDEIAAAGYVVRDGPGGFELTPA